MRITSIPLGPVNCFLIHMEDGLVLVDSGTPGSGPQVVQAIESAGADPSKIRLLILTNGHYDHAGNAAWFQKQYGIPVAIHEGDADFVRSASMKVPRGTRLLGWIVGCIFTLTRFKSSLEGVQPEIFFSSETDLKVYGLDARLVEFSGHTLGSIGLLFPSGDLIAGDLVSNMRRPGLSIFGRDAGRMRRDIKGLRALGVRTIYPGHGKPFRIEDLKTD